MFEGNYRQVRLRDIDGPPAHAGRFIVHRMQKQGPPTCELITTDGNVATIPGGAHLRWNWEIIAGADDDVAKVLADFQRTVNKVWRESEERIEVLRTELHAAAGA